MKEQQASILEQIGKVMQMVVEAAIVVALLLALLFVVVLLAILKSTPALLRLLAIALWVVSLGYALVSVALCYFKFADMYVSITTAAAAAVYVALVPTNFFQKEPNDIVIFGGFYGGALAGFTISFLANSVAAHPEWYVVAGVTPPTLAVFLLIYVVVTNQKGEINEQQNQGPIFGDRENEQDPLRESEDYGRRTLPGYGLSDDPF